MFSKDYRYVAIDFETTGLDPNKDEGIQIGLVEIDCNWKIIKEFSSLIQPKTDVKKVKEIVEFITWISLEKIQGAPFIEEIQDKIFEFFGDNTILIGHNIQFDVHFLTKYFPDIKFYDSIDSFQLAQTFVHFPPSYALEVLVEFMQKDFLFVEWFKLMYPKEDFTIDLSHDALIDSKNSLSILIYFAKYIDKLSKKYPELSNFIDKNIWIWKNVLNYTKPFWKQNLKKLQLPKLTKLITNDVKIKNKEPLDIYSLENLTRYFTGNIDIKDLLSQFAENKNVIFAFGDVSKLNIAKNILNSLGLKNLGFVRNQQIIDYKMFELLLNQESLNDGELFFILKYLSCIDKDMSMIELNSKSDFEIFYSIRDTKAITKHNTVLTTHWGLFSVLENKEHIYHDYTVCFFDIENWYRNYNSFMSKECDLYKILSTIESISYKYKLINKPTWMKLMKKTIEFFQILMGTIFLDTKEYFVHTSENKIQISNIIDNINFFKSNQILKQIDDYIPLRKKHLNNEDYELLNKNMEDIKRVFSTTLYANKRLYDQFGSFYFTFSEAMQYTSWPEFIDIFWQQTLFLSNHDTSYKFLSEKKRKDNHFEYLKLNTIEKLLRYIEDNKEELSTKNLFILSSKKDQSKEFFDKAFNSHLDKDLNILIENITWWAGKNIFKIKYKTWNIIMWGNRFLLNIFANKVSIDVLINFNISGRWEEAILDEIKWYERIETK